MNNELIKVGVTHGDINGIGYELLLKTFSDMRMSELCSTIVYGSSKVAAYYRKTLGLPAVNLNMIGKAEEARENRLNIINSLSDEEAQVDMGTSTAQSGTAAEKSLRAAVDDLKRGVIDVLVTSPVNMQNMRSESFPYASQQLFLQESLAAKGTLSIFINEGLRIAPAVESVAVKDITSVLTVDHLTQKLILLNQSLKEDFNIVRPRIAVLALNASGTDLATTGDEEKNVILPAMEEAERKGVMSFGPYQADEFFGNMQYNLFDAVLAMYYDQGVAPFKALSLDEGVVFTAGLPYICVSPNHGVLYEVTGKNECSESAFRNSFYQAIDLYRNRKSFAENTARPLRRQYYEKGEDNEKLDLTAEEHD